MTLLWAGLVVVVVTALAITAMLLARRQAPAGSYFEDGDRAAGVFGVIATGFAVLLGFVVFHAFESFDTSPDAEGHEAMLRYYLINPYGRRVEPAETTLLESELLSARKQ